LTNSLPARLVALTSYYNPFRGGRRLRNYHLFRKHLGVPLVTVEWSQEGHFELSAHDADVMIRVEGGDLMWQKERLLNIGLARIRSERLAADVAAIDADIVFDSSDWAPRVSVALDASPLGQCHAHANYLPQLPDAMQERADLASATPERYLPSLAYAVGRGEPLFTTDPERMRDLAVAGIAAPVSGNPGMAIALRLAELPDFEFYDGNIVGNGDTLLVSAYLGQLDAFFGPRQYCPTHRADIVAWAARCLPPLRTPRLAWADNRVLHLWHGSIEDRQYGQRFNILGPRNYDPLRHLDRSREALSFADGAGEIKAAVGSYLRSRNDA
jgi:hypothetical protein